MRNGCIPIPYLSIKDEPELCRQLVLSLIGRFVSLETPSVLAGLDGEAVRFARRLLRPFAPVELAHHLGVTDRYARKLLHKLVDSEHLQVTNGNLRNRLYRLRN